jgi:tetratricopeptide (TPR) repeat protein
MYSIKRNKIAFSAHPEIRIHHLGYKNSDVAKQKSIRNIQLLHKEIKNNPHDSILHMNLADCYLLIGKKCFAQKWYIKVIENKQLLQNNPDAYNQSLINIAIIYYYQNKFDLAQSYLNQCLDSDSNRIDAYFYLGKIFLDKKNGCKALEYFLKSATIEPGLRMTPIDTGKIKLNSIYYISEILISKNLYNEALNIIEAALTQYSNVPGFYSQMGKILSYQNRFKEAVFHLKISLQLNPSKNNEAMKVLEEISSKIKYNQEKMKRSFNVFCTSKADTFQT